MALFPEKFSCSSSQSGIQIDREEDRLKIFYEVWSGALKITELI
jgi:hypothetical protein